MRNNTHLVFTGMLGFLLEVQHLQAIIGEARPYSGELIGPPPSLLRLLTKKIILGVLVPNAHPFRISAPSGAITTPTASITELLHMTRTGLA